MEPKPKTFTVTLTVETSLDYHKLAEIFHYTDWAEDIEVYNTCIREVKNP